MVNKGISLKGQADIVTGGGAGIGRAICIALAAHGAKVLVADTRSRLRRRSAPRAARRLRCRWT